MPRIVGSSPRVRGRQWLAANRHRRVRLIPAGAGQTATTSQKSTSSRAHPRGCGADLSRSGHK